MTLGTVPSLFPEVRLRGITHEAESNSHCLGRETVVLVRWIFQPVALIVRQVSSTDCQISDNACSFNGKEHFLRLVGRALEEKRGPFERHTFSEERSILQYLTSRCAPPPLRGFLALRFHPGFRFAAPWATILRRFAAQKCYDPASLRG